MQNIDYKPIPQQAMMGCGIAAIACSLGCSYKYLINKYKWIASHHDLIGFDCQLLVKILKDEGVNTVIKKVTTNTKFENGDIIFVKGDKLPYGHYLTKANKGFMDCWINYPKIYPRIQAGFVDKLPAKGLWVITKKR